MNTATKQQHARQQPYGGLGTPLRRPQVRLGTIDWRKRVRRFRIGFAAQRDWLRSERRPWHRWPDRQITKVLLVMMWLSLIWTIKETTMKLTAMVLATAFALSSTCAF